MCWQCDHPDRTWLDYLAHLRGLIACHGWAVQGVERDRIHPPWAYTVGLTLAGRPELAVTGLPLGRATRLLNDVAAHVLHAEAPRPGERIPLHGGPLIEIVTVAEPAAHMVTAVELYGPGIRALQVVHADDRERWPWEAGYRGVRGGQPVLGSRAARPASAA
jgi:transposase